MPEQTEKYLGFIEPSKERPPVDHENIARIPNLITLLEKEIGKTLEERGPNDIVFDPSDSHEETQRKLTLLKDRLLELSRKFASEEISPDELVELSLYSQIPEDIERSQGALRKSLGKVLRRRTEE